MMKVNPKIKEVIDEIAKEAVNHFNTDKAFHAVRIRKLYRLFRSQLTEEEQLFIVMYFLESLHYKNTLVDPETLITASNIKLRTIFFIVISVIFIMIAFALLFKTNSSLNFISDIFSHVIAAIQLAK
jgi:hypothetical protein